MYKHGDTSSWATPAVRDEEGASRARHVGAKSDVSAARGIATVQPRSISVCFRRDPSRDRLDGNRTFQGYQLLWPDGRPIGVGLDAFCKHGMRLFGLCRQLSEAEDRLVELLCFPLACREASLTRLPGHRIRRFCLRRTRDQGRVHFLDGTPTEVVFDLRRDEGPVLHWIGLPLLKDGDHHWLDLGARSLDTSPPGTKPCLSAP